MVSFGWGIGIFAGVYAAFATGGHINPAVTLGIVASGASELAPGIAVTANVGLYIAGQLAGGVLGAVACWLAYKQHFDLEPDPAVKLGVFSTGPQLRNYGWNLVTEALGAFVLVFVVLMFANTPSGLGPLAAGLLVVGIGAGLGGPTGFAINSARDLGPRIAHFILPIKGKGSSDWSYAWVPVVGPIIGGVAAGFASTLF